MGCRGCHLQGRSRLHSGVTRHVHLVLMRQDITNLPLPTLPYNLEAEGFWWGAIKPVVGPAGSIAAVNTIYLLFEAGEQHYQVGGVRG